jgi:hypothetical protein
MVVPRGVREKRRPVYTRPHPMSPFVVDFRVWMWTQEPQGED